MLVRRKYIIDNKNIYLFGRLHYLHPCSPSVAASTSKEMELETGGITTLSSHSALPKSTCLPSHSISNNTQKQHYPDRLNVFYTTLIGGAVISSLSDEQ